MRKLLISVAAIGCLAIPTAWAQPDHDRGHGNGPQGGGGRAAGAWRRTPWRASRRRPSRPWRWTRASIPTPTNPAVSHGANNGESARPTTTTTCGYSRGATNGNSGRPVMTTNPNYSRGPGGSGF